MQSGEVNLRAPEAVNEDYGYDQREADPVYYLRLQLFWREGFCPPDNNY